MTLFSYKDGIMDCDIQFVIFLSHSIYIFKLKITWGLNYHMTLAICIEAFDAVGHCKMKPVNWCLDRKRSPIIAFVENLTSMKEKKDRLIYILIGSLMF